MGGTSYIRGITRRRLGALFQQFREGGLRVAFDNQAFLFRPTLTLSALRVGFLRHVRLLSQKIPTGEKLVPQPGVGPGRPEWSHGCKPCASTISATGARNTLDAGTVTPLKVSPVPTFFGPSNAALQPFSRCSSLCIRTRLNGGAQHANHRFEDLAVSFREVRWVLDKAIWYAWQRQALKSDWNFGPRFAGHIFMGQVRSGLWFWPSILSRCCTQCSRFSSRDIRRECYSRFG